MESFMGQFLLNEIAESRGEGGDGISDLIVEDWLAPSFNANELTDFPDDEIAASLANFSGREFPYNNNAVMQGFRGSPSPGIRSLSMNDLQTLEGSAALAAAAQWHRVASVSVKPSLQSVPEGAPTPGGPILPPMAASVPIPVSAHPAHAFMSRSAPDAGDSFLGTSSDSAHLASHGSTGSLSSLMNNQLQLKRDSSNGQLSGMDAAQLQAAIKTSQSMDFSRWPQGISYPGQSSAHSPVSVLTQVLTQANAGMFGLPPGQMALVPGFHMPGTLPPITTAEGAEGAAAVKAEGEADADAEQFPLRKSQSAVELGAWRRLSQGELDSMDPCFGGKIDFSKIGRLSVDERLQRIQRYRAKRDIRNYNRGIKYQCRKTLADTRPRVGGRFARNDDPNSVMPHETKKAQRERAKSEKAAAGGTAAQQRAAAAAASAAAQQTQQHQQAAMQAQMAQMQAYMMAAAAGAAAAAANGTAAMSGLPPAASNGSGKVGAPGAMHMQFQGQQAMQQPQARRASDSSTLTQHAGLSSGSPATSDFMDVPSRLDSPLLDALFQQTYGISVEGDGAALVAMDS